MKTQNLKCKMKIYRRIFFIIFLMFNFCCLLPTADVFAEEEKGSKWTGIDESVVEKYASEHGRETREPYINTDQGDLLLFVFLLAGAVGGFIGGYYWKTLIELRSQKSEVKIETTESK